jgi:phosphatidylglycerol---prolipoprotein diacylglyceryl transferase
MPQPPNPVAFKLPFPCFTGGKLELCWRDIYWYGLLVTLGTLVGAFVADREARRKGKDPDHVWNALILVMIFGLIGARLYHVISSPADSGTNLQHYLANPVEIFAFWNGGLRGLGIFGALLGGTFGLWLYTKWKKLSFLEWADICIIGVPIGQAIGRWGNYFNQELYGNPTKLPWGVQIAPEYRSPQFANLPVTTRFHPSFLYESLWSLGVFFVLSYVSHRMDDRLRTGDLVLLYLMLYPIGRILVEFQRPDAWVVAGVPMAQIISVGLVAFSALALMWRHGVFGGRRARAA